MVGASTTPPASRSGTIWYSLVWCTTGCRLVGASTTPLPLGLELCAPSPPFLCYQAITALPSAPHRHAIMNTLSAPAPRCILAAAGLSQIFHVSRKLSHSHTGFEERCGDLSWELEWARTLTLPISGTPLKSEVKGGSSEQRGGTSTKPS